MRSNPAAPRRGRPPLDPAFQRGRILTAATDIFITHGFAHSSVDAIGKAAGVTKRTIYELIGDKESLFAAVCVKLCAEAGAFHFDAAVTDLPVRDILIDMAETLVSYALDPRTLGFTRMLAVEALRFPGLVVATMEAGRREMHGTVSGVFADLSARGKIGPVDPSRAADTFYDGVVGARAMRAMLGYAEPHPSAAEIEERVEMVLRGYLAAGG